MIIAKKKDIPPAPVRCRQCSYSRDFVGNSCLCKAKAQLLNKLKFQREQKKMDVSDDSLLYALQYLLSSVKEGWIFDNFSVTNINSKFNEIVAQAKNGNNRKPDTKPDESSAGIKSIVFGKQS